MKSARKYLRFFYVGLLDNISDAGKTMIWMITEGIMAFVFIFIWLSASSGQDTIGGVDRGQIIAYYFFTFISWYLIGGFFHFLMADSIRTGRLSNQLVKPVMPFAQDIMKEQSWKVFGFFASMPIFLILLVLFGQFADFSIDSSNVPFVILSLILGGIVFGALDFIVGSFAFWLDRVNGIRALNSAFFNILGGYYIPFILLPEAISAVAQFLPYRYTFSFPIDILQGQVGDGQLLGGFIVQIIWAIVLIFICNLVLKIGLRRYESFGN